MRIILYYLLLLNACRDQKEKTLYDPGKTYASKTEPIVDGSGDAIKGGDKAPDETLVPPVPISGTYLRCRESDGQTEVRIDLACRLEDEGKNRLLPSQIALRVDYLPPVPSAPELSVELHIAAEDEDYDVQYRFRGPDFELLKQEIARIELRLEFHQLLSGEASGYLLGSGPELVSEAAPPWWIRESASDTNQDGKCQAGETCRFESSGLLWTRDGGMLYGFPGAQSLCDTLSDGFNDWRVPSEPELRMAFAKKITALNSSEHLNLRAARYWTETPAAGGEMWIVDTETGVSSPRNPSDAFGVLCVRPLHDLEGVLP